MSIDPVCGRSVNPKQSEWLLVHNGEAHHFCSAKCRDTFRGHSAAARVDGSAPRLIQSFVIATQAAPEMAPIPREGGIRAVQEVALAV